MEALFNPWLFEDKIADQIFLKIACTCLFCQEALRGRMCSFCALTEKTQRLKKRG